MQKTKNISNIINTWYTTKYQDNTNIPLEIKKLKTGTYTEAYKFQLSGKNNSIFFAKKKKKTDIDKDNLVEYNTMKQLWNSHYSKNKTYFIPEPLGYLEDHEFLITEYIEGKKVSNLISRSCFFGVPNKYFLDAVIRVKEVARWLSDYERHFIDYESIDFSKLVNKFSNKNLDNINFFSNNKKESIISFFNFFCNSKSLPLHLVNTDFKVHNIILRNNEVVVFDWEKMKGDFPIFWMATSFVRSLDNLSNRWFISNSRIEKLVEIFIDEYLRLTRFSDYIDFFPLIRIFEILTFLSEHNIGNRKIIRNDVPLAQKLDDLLRQYKNESKFESS